VITGIATVPLTVPREPARLAASCRGRRRGPHDEADFAFVRREEICGAVAEREAHIFRRDADDLAAADYRRLLEAKSPLICWPRWSAWCEQFDAQERSLRQRELRRDLIRALPMVKLSFTASVVLLMLNCTASVNASRDVLQLDRAADLAREASRCNQERAAHIGQRTYSVVPSPGLSDLEQSRAEDLLAGRL